jgi:hypothetical protein
VDVTPLLKGSVRKTQRDMHRYLLLCGYAALRTVSPVCIATPTPTAFDGPHGELTKLTDTAYVFPSLAVAEDTTGSIHNAAAEGLA